MKYNLLNALIYEVCLMVTDEKPLWVGNQIVKIIKEHCFKDWVEWRTDVTMTSVDIQTEKVKEVWQEEDNKKVVEKFQTIYPDAKVTTHDEITGAVLIEHPSDGSTAQDLLGGAMEIKSPWSLPEDK